MTPSASRLSLLALAIAANSSSALAVPGCPITLGSANAEVILNQACAQVTIPSTTTIIANNYDSEDVIEIRTTIGSIDNYGTLNGTGNSSGTLYITSLGSLDTLNNWGTISNNSYGIYLESASNLTINQISGSINAPNAITNLSAGILTLNWSGGSISGLVNGANQVNVDGDVDFSNTSFTAGTTTLNWNGGSIIGAITGLNTIIVNGDVRYRNASANQMINVASGARLTLEQDRTTLTGSLTLASNAKLDMYLSSATPVASGTGDGNAIVTGLGTATFGNSSQIGLKVRGADFAADNTTYTLLSGEGIVNNGLSVVARDSALLRVDSFAVNAGKVVATVSTVDQYNFIGNSPNAQSAGSAILPLLSTMATNSPNNPVLDALAGDAQQVADTAEQLVPQVNGASLQAAYGLNNTAHLNANQRTQGLRGQSSGDSFKDAGLWMKALGSQVEQDSRDGIEGYDADLSGLAIGADTKVTDQLTLGLAYSYLNSDISADGGNQADIDGHAITLYSGYEQDAWFLDSSLTLGLNHNDSTRYIAGTEAKGDYDSQLLGLDVLGGYGIQLDNGLQVEPRAAARYARVDIDSFREKGSIAALDVDDQRYEVVELGAGVRLSGNLPLGQGTLQPEAKVMVYHDFAADRVATSASFTFGGSPFLATGASPARTRYEAGLGLEYKLAATTFGVSYDYSGKEDFQTDTLQAKVRYDF